MYDLKNLYSTENGEKALESLPTALGAQTNALGSDYGSIEYTGLGGSFSIDVGDGAKLTMGYSQRKGKTKSSAGVYQVLASAETLVTAEDGNADGTDDDPATVAQIEASRNASASVDSKVSKLELGMSYDLGGGATLKATVKQEKNKTTTMELKIAFSF